MRLNHKIGKGTAVQASQNGRLINVWSNVVQFYAAQGLLQELLARGLVFGQPAANWWPTWRDLWSSRSTLVTDNDLISSLTPS